MNGMKEFVDGDPASPTPTPGTLLQAEYLSRVEDVRMLFEGRPGVGSMVNALRFNDGAFDADTLLAAIAACNAAVPDPGGEPAPPPEPLTLLIPAGTWEIDKVVDFTGGKILPLIAPGAHFEKTDAAGRLIFPLNHLMLGRLDAFDFTGEFVSLPDGGVLTSLSDLTTSLRDTDTVLSCKLVGYFDEVNVISEGDPLDVLFRRNPFQGRVTVHFPALDLPSAPQNFMRLFQANGDPLPAQFLGSNTWVHRQIVPVDLDGSLDYLEMTVDADHISFGTANGLGTIGSKVVLLRGQTVHYLAF